ncbi:hypothetical protein CSKR_100666 [Clonorchis sinensis]|uniref:Uncharacterized protein n=1 Tax=Clonorchis sinensis TaxID=79923 RepID=A0A419PG99_CLOSI|nr:hypothetical protein CSKR_100666 [Clonorchis sinensis]
MHYHFYGTSRHMFQPSNWRARRLFVRPLTIDQPVRKPSHHRKVQSLHDGLSDVNRLVRETGRGPVRTLPSIAQWVAEVRKPPHHGKVQSLRDNSASRLPLSRLGQPGNIPTLLLPSGGMAARHRKGVTDERFFLGRLTLLYRCPK